MIFLKKKYHARIEYIKDLIKEKAVDFKGAIREELEEFEILLYGKKGLKYKIDRLDDLLYGEVDSKFFNELLLSSHFSNNLKILTKGSYSFFVLRNLIRSISQIGIINIGKLAAQQIKLSNRMHIINKQTEINEELLYNYKHKKK